MDTLSSLQRRNIELETELRLIKDQLAEARSGTQYLINCLSGQYAPLNTHDNNTYAITNSTRIRHELEDDLISGSTFTESTACVENPNQDYETPRRESLIDFEDQNHSPSTITDQTETFTASTTPILIDSPIQEQVEWHAHRGPVNHSPTSRHRSAPTAVYAPTPIHPINQPRADRLAQSSRIQQPHRFEDHEHNRLMGSAMFIEEMNEEEQMQHWKKFQFKNRNHSVLEWKTYYETVIRPAFLQKYGAAGKAEVEAVEVKERKAPPTDVKDLWFKKGESDPDLFRTVVITNLRPDITLSEVWSDFKLGWEKVAYATLLRTGGMKTTPPLEGDGAMIIFRSAEIAKEFADQYEGQVEVVRTASRTS